MLEVTLLIKPDIETALFYKTVTDALQKPVTRVIDEQAFDPKDVRSFLIACYSALDDRATYQEMKANFGRLLKHVSYTFLVATSDSLNLEDLAVTKIPTVFDADLLVVSGSLHQWQQAILDGSVSYTDRPTRIFLNKCLLLLEQEDYHLPQYKKVIQKDHTFLLEKI